MVEVELPQQTKPPETRTGLPALVDQGMNWIKRTMRPQREREIPAPEEDINHELVTRAMGEITAGKSIYTLLADEQTNSETKRRITREWIGLMSREPRSDINSTDYSEGDLARRSFYQTWDVLYSHLLREGELTASERPASDPDIYRPEGHNAWGPRTSANLIKEDARTSGFLSAIAESCNGETIQTACDAGTGSTALLALAFAVNGAKVEAYELSPEAAEVANHWVNFLGFTKEQIEIIEGDVFTSKPHAQLYDRAASETFYRGLAREDGARIMHLLSQRAKRIIPDRVKIYATDQEPEDDMSDHEWQEAGEVRFADLDYSQIDARSQKPRAPKITGSLKSTGNPVDGYQPVWVRVGYYSGDQPVLDGVFNDDIAGHIRLGYTAVPRNSQPVEITFSYPPGIQLSRRQANTVLESPEVDITSRVLTDA